MKYFNVFLGLALSLALLAAPSFADTIKCPDAATGSEADNWLYNLTDNSDKPIGNYAPSVRSVTINNMHHIVDNKDFKFTQANVSADLKLTCEGTFSIATNDDATFVGKVTAERTISSDEYNQCTIQPDGISFACTQ